MFDKASFKAESRWQVCAQCGLRRPWHAHHVVYEQHVRALNRTLIFHPDNSLRLCIEPCHPQQHNRVKVLDVAQLRTENIDFAVRLMGRDPAIVYFGRYYKDESGLLIPRIDSLEVAA